MRLTLIILILVLQSLNAQIILQLTSPIESDTISNLRPGFNWITTQINERTSFGLKLVKNDFTQSSENAILNNIPLINIAGILSQSFPFPFSLPDLDSSSVYSWQIIQFDLSIPVSISPVGRFYTPHLVVFNDPFIDLNSPLIPNTYFGKRLLINYKIILPTETLLIEFRNIETNELIIQKELEINQFTSLYNIESLTQYYVVSNSSVLVNLKFSRTDKISIVYHKL